MNAEAGHGDGVGLVVFDWGGVILRICRSFEEGCAAAGLPVRFDAELSRPDRRAVHDRYQRGQLSCDAFFGALAEHAGGVYSVEEIERIHDAWLLEEYEGIEDVLIELESLPHVETALLSNTNPRHWSRQEARPDGRPHFPAVRRLGRHFASHILKLAKPDEAIYRVVEEATGMSGRRVLFFDDLEENIAAARRVGWRAERIDHTGSTAAQIREHLDAHRVFGR